MRLHEILRLANEEVSKKAPSAKIIHIPDRIIGVMDNTIARTT